MLWGAGSSSLPPPPLPVDDFVFDAVDAGLVDADGSCPVVSRPQSALWSLPPLPWLLVVGVGIMVKVAGPPRLFAVALQGNAGLLAVAGAAYASLAWFRNAFAMFAAMVVAFVAASVCTQAVLG